MSWNLKPLNLALYGRVVSLLVRLWVEIDVFVIRLQLAWCQPPCEAVSWNRYETRVEWVAWKSASLWGCELKFTVFYNLSVHSWSASLWGCELKFQKVRNGVAGVKSQPPCEAVSWNVPFVALAVELARQPPCEAVSWNASWRKYGEIVSCQPPCEAVSWNTSPVISSIHWLRSASLWGCELKYERRKQKEWKTWSASLWGCELKSLYQMYNWIINPSASLWGCELKYFKLRKQVITFSQPPCEAVSWNVE